MKLYLTDKENKYTAKVDDFGIDDGEFYVFILRDGEWYDSFGIRNTTLPKLLEHLKDCPFKLEYFA